jgi:hypothetical protein
MFASQLLIFFEGRLDAALDDDGDIDFVGTRGNSARYDGV